MTTRKQSATKPATKKVEVVEVSRDNRYVRASRVIINNLTIDTEQLSKEAEMSGSTARHTREAFDGVVSVLLQHGAISQTWRTKLSPKNDTKAEPTPVATAK